MTEKMQETGPTACIHDLATNCRAAIVTQIRFVTHNICHTKRISASQEKQDMYREKRDNKTRGGKLPLSGSVQFNVLIRKD